MLDTFNLVCQCVGGFTIGYLGMKFFIHYVVKGPAE